MRYVKLAVLSLMLGCILALSPNTPRVEAGAKNFCWDCYSQVGSGQFCYDFASCGQFWGECNYAETPTTFCPEPFLISCCPG